MKFVGFVLVAAILVINHPLAGQAAPVANITSQIAGSAKSLPKGAVPSRLLIEPQDKDHELIHAIDKAQNQIFVETYILSDKLVVRALERAAVQQVRVYVLLEPHPIGLGPQPENMAAQLRAAGIYVRWTSARFALTHAKFLVIDDRLAIISTANLSRAGFHSDRDFLLFDRSATDVRQTSAIFRADWDHLRVRSVAANLIVSPDDSRSKLAALIRSAHHVIRLYAEEIGDTSIEKLLVTEHRKGVIVQVVLESGATPVAAAYLRVNGVSLREMGSPYIHAKVLDVDDHQVFVGSENLSTQSLDLNREVGLLIRGPDVARIVSVFESDWRRAKG